MIEALIFDWGDTLMRVFFEYTGAMVHWPKVGAMPGIREALRDLHDKYRLFVATNAADSDSTLVREALARVDLDRFFEAIWTSQDLMAHKPEPAFFRAISRRMTCPVEKLVMIGDNHQNDIVQAKNQGFQTIWLVSQPDCAIAHPACDALCFSGTQLLHQIAHLGELPDLVVCENLRQEFNVPDRIKAHMDQVAQVAYRLALWLHVAGRSVDPLVVHRAALLHDLDKEQTRQIHSQHGLQSGNLLRRRGYPKVAGIVEHHRLDAILDPDLQPKNWEERLVYYADKLLEGDHLVPLAQRMAAFRSRYPQSEQLINRCEPMVHEIEKRLVAILGTSTEELFFRLTHNKG